MCDPTLIMAGVSVVSAVGQLQAASTQEDLAFNEARNRENQAQDVRSKGVEEENIQRQKTAQLLSKQRATQAASGIDIESGSAADIQQDTVILGEADARRIKSNFGRQADVLEQGAALTLAAGKSRASATRGRAIGSLLTAGAKGYSQGVDSSWFSSDSAALSGSAAAVNPGMWD